MLVGLYAHVQDVGNSLQGPSNSRNAHFGMTYKLRLNQNEATPYVNVGDNIGVVFLSFFLLVIDLDIVKVK